MTRSLARMAGLAGLSVIAAAVVHSIAAHGRIADPTPSGSAVALRPVDAGTLARIVAQALPPNQKYDGRFTFTRIIYSGVGGFRRSSWNHDYPMADANLPNILDFLTSIDVNLEGHNVNWLDDPELFKFPIIYISEPGTWGANEAEISGLRKHLLKGGFAIFDDFEEDQWINFEYQLKRALPEYEIVKLDFTHPVFHSFFELDNVALPHPFMRVVPGYYGVFEDNDPNKRMMVMICHNADIAEYWEYAGTGFAPMDMTNDSFKLGVNFIMYAMLH